MSILKHRTIDQCSIQIFDKYIDNHTELGLQITDEKKAEFGFYFLFLSYVHNLY